MGVDGPYRLRKVNGSYRYGRWLHCLWPATLSSDALSARSCMRSGVEATSSLSGDSNQVSCVEFRVERLVFRAEGADTRTVLF